MRLHLQHRNFDKALLDVTERFFQSGPWTGSAEDRMEKLATWMQGASEHFGLGDLVLIAHPTEGPAWAPQGIVIAHLSVTEVFHEFRHILQHHNLTPCTAESTYAEREHDAISWAYSLYYAVRPKGFRSAVRKGLMPGVTPEQLLSDATVARLEAEAAQGLTDIEQYLAQPPTS